MNKRAIAMGGAGLLCGQGIGQVLSLARHAIVARLIGPTEMGVAALLTLTLYFFELATQMSSDRHLIQARDGDDDLLQRAAHFVCAVRGAISAVILCAVAWPLALLFGVPEATWAFAALGLATFVRGFVHLDHKRAHRELRFAPEIRMELASQVAATLAAWPVAIWLGNYSAMLVLLVGKSAIYTVVSHVVAVRAYRWSLDRVCLTRLLVFGWPLALNGLLYFMVVQGDLLIIGATYEAYEVGLYAIALTLTAAPVLLVGRVGGAIVLPTLSPMQDKPTRFASRYYRFFGISAAVGGVFAVCCVVGGHVLVEVIYGAAFAEAGVLVAWLGVMHGIRMVRVVPNTAAIALGDTRAPLQSNIARILGVPILLVLALDGSSLTSLAICGCVAETAGLIVGIRRIERRLGEMVPSQSLLRLRTRVGRPGLLLESTRL